jgi:tetratricopeptide (TPR) repeat protein
MKSESIVFAVAGMCFGVILGWVIAVQQVPGPTAPETSAEPAGSPGSNRPAPVLDEARVQALTTILKSDPQNAKAAVQLADTYFDGGRYDDAIIWYTQALSVDPRNVDASTDLGLSYYYVGQIARALRQFEASLTIDPRHAKTLLNQGIVLAFGKQDLTAASAAWQKAVEFAPDSPEGQAARRALEGVSSAGHP